MFRLTLFALLAIGGSVYGKALNNHACKEVGFYPLADNAADFYGCYRNKAGGLTIMYFTCGADQVFSASAGYCVQQKQFIHFSEAMAYLLTENKQNDIENPTVPPKHRDDETTTQEGSGTETTEVPSETTTKKGETTPEKTTEIPSETTTRAVETTTRAGETTETEVPGETTEQPETTTKGTETESPEETTTVPQETTTEAGETTDTTAPGETTEDPETTTKGTETESPEETTAIPPETTTDGGETTKTTVPGETTVNTPESTVPGETTVNPPETTTSPGETTGTETTTNPETTDVTGTTTTESGKETTTEAPFICPTNGFYPHDGDCSKFNYCTVLNGKTVVVLLKCPAGQQFNPLSGFCDAKYDCQAIIES